jgi:hypothetical protein
MASFLWTIYTGLDRRKNMKTKPFKSKRILFAGCLTIILCGSLVSIFASIWWRAMRDVNLNTATQVTQEFVENIYHGNIELAYSMLSERFSPPISQDQFSELLQEDHTIFSTYEKLEICDWGVFIDDGYVIDTSGLLYFQGRPIVVLISLHKDSDAVWRIQGFRFRPDIDPVPFGLCE